MNNWHLIPWTLQYLISGIAVILISAFIFTKNRRSLAYQSFFYGICTATWVILAFLHRIAPTAEMSRFFFRIDLFFVLVGQIFLPMTILCIRNERKAYLWLGLPAFITGIYSLIKTPYETCWSNFGWSYKFVNGFGNDLLKSRSRNRAYEWLEQILREHTGF